LGEGAENAGLENAGPRKQIMSSTYARVTDTDSSPLYMSVSVAINTKAYTETVTLTNIRPVHRMLVVRVMINIKIPKGRGRTRQPTLSPH